MIIIDTLNKVAEKESCFIRVVVWYKLAKVKTYSAFSIVGLKRLCCIHSFNFNFMGFNVVFHLLGDLATGEMGERTRASC